MSRNDADTRSAITFADRAMSMPTIEVSADSAAPSAVDRGRGHLRFLDGIRGLAALYVVACHAVIFGSDNFSRAQLTGVSYFALKWVAYGQFAVAFFIVLSGYCLMLPVVKSVDGTLRGGARGYFFRRARRILPPYYVALLMTLLLLWTRPGLPSSQQLGFGAVVSHLTMLQLLRPEWNHALNSPMWSVATEWWIYFALPWILIPVWRRWGPLRMIGAAVVVAALPSLWQRWTFDWARPWYLVLFAMGAAAADLGHGRSRDHRRACITRSALVVALAATLVLGICFGTLNREGPWYSPIIDTLQGTIAVGFVIWLASDGSAALFPHIHGWARTVIESKGIHFLGTISYSLYLVHYPLLELLNDVVVRAGVSGLARVGIVGAIGTAAATAFAYLFYLPFERPFCRPGRPSREVAGAA
jgi:peptidoglycan/LPS O-acetylase OafA/YrhL